MTILDRLEQLLPTASRTTFREMLRDRRITVNGLVVTSLKEPLRAADELKIADRRSRGAARAGGARPASRPPVDIVFEDRDLLVVNKTAGLITSSGPRDGRPTLLGVLRSHFANQKHVRIGLVHRLDADAAGLIVFSKHDVALAALKRQFADHSARREYVALLDGVPAKSAGTIESLLMERADGRVRSTFNPSKGERAVTHYEVLKSAAGQSLVRVRLETGRKHQIRAHFAEMNCPIVNDRIYCPREPHGPLKLMAVTLGLTHPTNGKPVKWELPAPKWL
jgi:23S rRNA pseudouridine1911/1915/1917 synthase